MIICTRCGTKNPDNSPYCEKCGKKLQSARAHTEEKPRKPELEETIRFDFWKRCSKNKPRYGEAWAYALAVVAVSLISLRYGEYWPVYVVVILAAVLAKTRL